MSKTDTEPESKRVALSVNVGSIQIGAPTVGVMARSLGALYMTGSALAFGWLALPHEGGGSDRLVMWMAACAFVGGVALMTPMMGRLPVAFIHAVLLWVQVLISVAYVAGGVATNDMRFFYIWATPFACLFFRPRHALAHAIFVAVAMAGALVVLPASPGEALRIWSITIGTLGSVAALVLWAATGLRRREIALHHAATHDPLTGLANRALFAELVDEALRRRRTEGGQVYVLLADLDRFKMVNDTHGHHAGDQLLIAFAPELQRVAPPGAVVARMGGDEFALLIDDPTGVLDPVAVLTALTSAWEHPIELDRISTYTSASLGLAVAHDEATPSSLLRDADAAMYSAKRTAPGACAVFDDRLRERDQRMFTIEQSLHDAVEHREFHVVYQPLLELATGTIRSAEVLVRWRHRALGDVSPAEFIPVAEETGMIVGVGTWVLTEAIAQLGRWRAGAIVDDDFVVCVNISGRQLQHGLVTSLAELLAVHHVPARCVHVELTETAVLDASPEATRTLNDLRAMGISLVLDDFGTGFSSLSHLQRAKFDALKIDRSFIDEVDRPGTDRSIVVAIVALATALGLRIVAEGVETEVQANTVRSLGCHQAQGYHFHRPMPAEELALVLQSTALDATVVADQAPTRVSTPVP